MTGDDDSDARRDSHRPDGDHQQYGLRPAEACGGPRCRHGGVIVVTAALRGCQFRFARGVAERALQLPDPGFRIVLRIHPQMLA